MERNWLDVVCLILIIIGAVNWGLIGFFNLDLVSFNIWQYVHDYADHFCGGRYCGRLFAGTLLKTPFRIRERP